jgi:putative FmdB family regulatory protein
MPLYEYQCKKCGHKFEKIQLFSDKPIKKCPECGGAVEKLISRSAVQFKGSGWYATDYAKKSDSGGSNTKSSGDSSSGESASGTDSASGKESKSGDSAEARDSKPKPKTESSEKKSHKK